MSNQQTVSQIELNKDGEITYLVTSDPEATLIREKVAYDGACKNIFNEAVDYFVIDRKGVKRKVIVNDKSELAVQVEDKEKDLKTYFTENLTEKDIKKMQDEAAGVPDKVKGNPNTDKDDEDAKKAKRK